MKRAGLLMALALAGCAGAKAAAPGASAVATQDPFDQRADELMRALQSGDVTRVEALFDEKLKAALPPEKLNAILTDMDAKVGVLVSWTSLVKSHANGLITRDLDVTFSKSHLIAHVVLQPETRAVAGLFFKARPEPYVPAPVDPASPYRAEEFKLGTDPCQLGATLTIPKTGGPFPAVVLVHGSGPHDRDETVGANKPFRDLADGLSSRGIVVLRYDKRTYACAQQMDALTTTVDEEVIIDAVAAVALLRARPEVDPKRIFVLGHSLGATLAPEIALRAAPVAGVVMLAPASRPLPLVIVDQLRVLGMPEAQIQEVAREARRLMDGQFKPDEDFFGAPAHYWMDLLGRDEVAAGAKLGVPILILRGDRDYQVGAADIDGWQKGLAIAPHVTIKTLPGLNHLFMKGEGAPGPAEYDKPGHMDAGVVEMLARFIGG